MRSDQSSVGGSASGGEAAGGSSTAASTCDAVTTPTRRSADYLERMTGLEHVHAISCGIRASDYTVSPTRNRGTMVFVGRVTSEKRIEVAIRAYDPCLSCATHALGEMPLRIELHNSKHELLDVVVRD